MSKKVLTTPIQDKDLEDIKIGDVIYLTGTLVTARDAAHTRLVKLGRKLPVDLKGKAIFHAGPIMVHRKDDPTKFNVVSIGPTTSMRMEKFQKQFLEQTGTKLIVGKGAAWVLIRPRVAKKRKLCTVCSPAAAQWWPLSALKRSKTANGLNSACRKPCG